MLKFAYLLHHRHLHLHQKIAERQIAPLLHRHLPLLLLDIQQKKCGDNFEMQ
jgi:hypothetical protein